ncbi:hypothetical protein D049_1478B, partial [Vibrio parahaemolyticus VPTS-2010]|jgi:UPF0148 protein
VYL